MNDSALIGMWQGHIEEITNDSFEAKLNDGRDDYYVEFYIQYVKNVDSWLKLKSLMWKLEWSDTTTIVDGHTNAQ